MNWSSEQFYMHFWELVSNNKLFEHDLQILGESKHVKQLESQQAFGEVLFDKWYPGKLINYINKKIVISPILIYHDVHAFEWLLIQLKQAL